MVILMKKYLIICFLLGFVMLITSCAINQKRGDLVLKTGSIGPPRKELPKSVLPNQDESLFTEEVKTFNMTVKRFSFDPYEITVEKGDKVRLIITSLDTAHGFAVLDYGVNIIVKADETVTSEFIADKAGQFNFACSVFCGSGHNEMKGRLIVK